MVACAAGVLAQTPRGTYGFTEGWVRLRLAACPGVAGAAAQLEVDGAGSFLAFKPGRSGGATVGVLAAMGDRALLSVQRFPVPVGSGAAREVVLAPVAAGPRPTFTQLRLVAP